MLASAADIKESGVEKLLEIFTAKLQPLETNGILVNGKRIYIASVSYLGDNLGLNLNMGFTSPTSTYFCRICFIDCHTSKECCLENEELIRTEEHYLECVNNIDPHKNAKHNFGVARRCDLNRLKSFKVYWNFMVDLMHDLLLGMFIYDLVELLKKGIKDNIFTLAQFNQAKNGFDYPSKELNYILEDITDAHLENTKIRGHAREIWALVKFLPFILYKFMNEDHELFKFSLTMVDLLDFVLKTKFTKEDLKDLNDLTTHHNQQFLSLFQRNLPPKAHFLLHYSTVIEHSGPLKYIWCMRFEAKHQDLKAYAKVCFNRRNLPFSLGKKMCFNDAVQFLNNEGLKRIRQLKRIDTSFHDQFNSKLKQNFKNCTRVNHNGRVYETGDYIMSDCLNYTYTIFQIAVDDSEDSVMIITEKHDLKYEPIFRSYEICDKVPFSMSCFNIDEFLYPATEAYTFRGKSYIKCEPF